LDEKAFFDALVIRGTARKGKKLIPLGKLLIYIYIPR